MGGQCTSVFFFFKQKTAYEMRISDWSSDVCSSDLQDHSIRPSSAPALSSGCVRSHRRSGMRMCARFMDRHSGSDWTRCSSAAVPPPLPRRSAIASLGIEKAFHRSEEHTSELQSLMRISHAVFCLKNKKKRNTHET